VAKVVPFTEARTHLTELLDDVESVHEHVVITRNGRTACRRGAFAGRLKGRWSARVGNYRIVYPIEGGHPQGKVVTRAVRHRAVAYGRRRRR
jgi:mRNA-degrading endonuclease RelE of RelBE toxin-antitoxin system